MTTNYHTPITTGAAANSSVVNSPLAQLDAELSAQEAELSDQGARITVVEGDMPVPSGVATEYYDGSGGFSVPAGTGAGVDGHLVQDEGVDLPQRAKINFTGANVAVVDTVGATEVRVSGVDTGGWVADVNTWSPYVRTQAYTNDPAIGVAVVLNMANTSDFIVGADVAVSSSAGAENTYVTAVVTNTSITVNQLLYNHTTSSPLVTLLDVFTVAGDVAAIFQKSTLIKWTQTTIKYGVVFSSVYSAPNTYIKLIHNTDYALSSASITANYYSYIPDPVGYPGWFNFDPALQGWSSIPTGAVYKYRIIGKSIYTFIGIIDNMGVSNATIATFSAPMQLGNVPTQFAIDGAAADNGTAKTTPCRTYWLSASRLITACSDMANGAWTAALGKRVVCMIFGEW